MQTRIVLLTIVTGLALVLAGCADNVPRGHFDKASTGLVMEGTVTFEYQDAQNPYPVPDEQVCALDGITGQDPTGTLPQCRPASTNITLMLHGNTKDPGSGYAYTLFLVGPEGEREVGAAQHTNGMWELNQVYDDENLAGEYERAEVRVDGFVVATFTVNPGGNQASVPMEVAMIGFDAAYTGRELSVNVTGLPPGASYTGWLVVMEEGEGGVVEAVHVESFPVDNGDNTFTAQRDIPEYDEFHIHIGDSELNIAIGTIS